MVADSSIYSLIRPVQPGPGPLQNYGQAMQLRALIDDQGLKQLQRQQLERGIQDDDALRGIEQEAMGDPAKIREGMSRRGLYRQRMDFDKNQAAAGKAEAEAMKIDRENFVALADNARKRMAAVRDPQAWQMFRDEQIQMAGMFKTPAIREMALRAAQSMPAEFNPNYIRDSLVKAEELFTPKIEMKDLGGKVVPVDVNPFTNPAVLRQDFTKTATPGEILTDTRTREEGAKNRGVTIRGQDMTDQRARDLAQATREAAASGRIPPGYRQTLNGDLEAIPGGPADKVNTKGVETQRTLDAYVAARDGLMSGLERTETGALSGRLPAMTTGQQIAEGGIAAMAPVLKQLFRTAGEGVFTDRDQQLLLDMVPKRSDTPEAAAEKMANIDRIVEAKLGVPVPKRMVRKVDETPKRRGNALAGPQGAPTGIKFLGYE